MFEFVSILLGVIITICLVLVIYPFIIYLRLKRNKKRVSEIYYQIKNQVDIKYNLISTMENKSKTILSVLEKYSCETDEVDLKKYNDCFNEFIYNCNDSEVLAKCNLAEEKINHIKDYYNEVASSHNSFKTTKLAIYLSKSFAINDAKLY